MYSYYTQFMLTQTLWQEEQEHIIKQQTWSDVIYMPCTAENDFVPDFPKEEPDIIYLCFPNNPNRNDNHKSTASGMG